MYLYSTTKTLSYLNTRSLDNPTLKPSIKPLYARPRMRVLSIKAIRTSNQENTEHTKCATTSTLATLLLLTSLSSIAAQDPCARTATLSSNGVSSRKTTGAHAAKPTSKLTTAAVVSKLAGLPVDRSWYVKMSWVFSVPFIFWRSGSRYAVVFN